MTSQVELWLERDRRRPENINPCVRAHGRGPEGQTCKGCVHLFVNQKTKAYWKCDLRAFSNGPGTDHKLRWPACGKYEPRKPETRNEEKDERPQM